MGRGGVRWWLVSSEMQFRVLGLGFFQDGDVGVGVFPEAEENWNVPSLLR
jgi:hypothetical protein